MQGTHLPYAPHAPCPPMRHLTRSYPGVRVSAQVCKGVIQPRAATSGVGQEVEDRFVSITHPLHALYKLNDVNLLVPVLPSIDGQSVAGTPRLASRRGLSELQAPLTSGGQALAERYNTPQSLQSRGH